MKFVCQSLILLAALPGLFAADADKVYQPLWLYHGHWKAKSASGDSAPKLVDIVNYCARVGRFFGCEQTVDGKPGAMVVYIPAETPGHFYTQAILPDGNANGRGELIIEGDRWTFQSASPKDEKPPHYKTTNVFSGKDRIHFEQLESKDGKHWEVKSSGDETRVAK
jgi:hypothetical protein